MMSLVALSVYSLILNIVASRTILLFSWSLDSNLACKPE